MNRFLLVALLVLIAAITIGCSDDPNAVGIALLPSSDRITIDTLTIRSSSSATDTARVQGISTNLLLGKYNHLEARTLLEFDGIPTDKPKATIDTALLTLHVNYRFMDSSGSIAINLYHLLLTWSSSTLTWDSLTENTYYQTTTKPDTTFYSSVQAGDSILTVNIRPVVAAWFLAENSTPPAVILVPDPLANLKFVLGFSNFVNNGGDFRPSLKITYHDSTAADTTTFTLAPSQQLFVANSKLPVPKDTMYVQAGIAYRGQVWYPDSLFRTGSPLKNASVTKAVMTVYLNAPASLRNAYTDNVIEARLALDSTSQPKVGSLYTQGTPNQNDSTMFTFDARIFIQQWLAGTPNYGIVLRAGNEYASFDGFKFYGARSDSAHRPTLKVTYTKFPHKVRRAAK